MKDKYAIKHCTKDAANKKGQDKNKEIMIFLAKYRMFSAKTC